MLNATNDGDLAASNKGSSGSESCPSVADRCLCLKQNDRLQQQCTTTMQSSPGAGGAIPAGKKPMFAAWHMMAHDGKKGI